MQDLTAAEQEALFDALVLSIIANIAATIVEANDEEFVD